jgi:hypothetical protein
MNSNQSLKNVIIAFIFFDLSLILYAIVFNTPIWLLNTQVAFISSLFITIGTFLSYKKNIERRLSSLEISKQLNNDRDKIDEIDDPYDLYTEYEEIPEEELTPEKIKEIISDEKSKVKKNSFKNTIFSATGFISVYRVLGYGTLILGFFALNNNKLFLPIAFIIGLAIVPIGVLASKLLDKNKSFE